jgi:alkyl hydroperoxide reductase subunit AhpF
MTLLNEQIRSDVRGMLADLPNPVTLKIYTEQKDCQYCKEARSLAEEVADLSDKISTEVIDLPTAGEGAGVDKAPALAIVGAKDYGIRMYGLPSGYEFGSLLEAIRLVSTGDSALPASTREAIERLKEPVHMQVFITPT